MLPSALVFPYDFVVCQNVLVLHTAYKVLSNDGRVLYIPCLCDDSRAEGHGVEVQWELRVHAGELVNLDLDILAETKGHRRYPGEIEPLHSGCQKPRTQSNRHPSQLHDPRWTYLPAQPASQPSQQSLVGVREREGALRGGWGREEAMLGQDCNNKPCKVFE